MAIHSLLFMPTCPWLCCPVTSIICFIMVLAMPYTCVEDEPSHTTKYWNAASSSLRISIICMSWALPFCRPSTIEDRSLSCNVVFFCLVYKSGAKLIIKYEKSEPLCKKMKKFIVFFEKKLLNCGKMAIFARGFRPNLLENVIEKLKTQYY